MNNIRNRFYEINADLTNSKNALDYIYDVLFEGNRPSLDYETQYDRLQAITAMCRDTLARFEGKYTLLLGEGDNPELAHEFEELKALHGESK